MTENHPYREKSTWDKESILKRNREMLLVWKRLRKEGKHSSKWCRQFLKRNYFMAENYIYKVMEVEALLDMHLFDPEEASLVYHHVMEKY